MSTSLEQRIIHQVELIKEKDAQSSEYPFHGAAWKKLDKTFSTTHYSVNQIMKDLIVEFFSKTPHFIAIPDEESSWERSTIEVKGHLNSPHLESMKDLLTCSIQLFYYIEASPYGGRSTKFYVLNDNYIFVMCDYDEK